MNTKILTLFACLCVSTSAAAFWGGPFMGNGWGPSYNNSYGRTYGGLGTEQYRGGDAAGGGDFSMSFSGRANTNMRGSGSGYGAGDGWGRGYNYGAPYYRGYPGNGYGYPPVAAPMAPPAE